MQNSNRLQKAVREPVSSDSDLDIGLCWTGSANKKSRNSTFRLSELLQCGQARMSCLSPGMVVEMTVMAPAVPVPVMAPAMVAVAIAIDNGAPDI